MYEDIKEKYQNLETQLSDPEVINNPPKLKEISQKHAELKPAIKLIEKLEALNTQIEENEQIVQENGEQEIKEMARQELEKLKPESEALTKQIKEELNPKDPNDKKNVIMEIRAGAGGEESSLFAADLFKMYSRYCEMQGWKLNILNSTETEIGGYKEINFEIKGQKVYSFLKYEGGAHRVQRIPETEKQGRVHTSAATTVVLPEAEAVEIEINNQDIRIDTFCASGPGGQSVNTTESAIRVTYLPENMVISCQDQKSQQQNREKALQILRSRLLAKRQEEQHQSEKNQRQKQVGSGDRSEKIRTYNFPQDRVTDHRIQQSWHNMEKIMNGEIDDIITALQEEELKLNENET